MAKINERILNAKDLEVDEEMEEPTYKVKSKLPEYGEIEIPKTWTNPPALIDLKHDIDYAVIEHEYIIREIDERLDFYHTTPGVGRPHKVKGRSNAQPQSIRKAAEWRYATLSEPFLDSPNLFKSAPTSGFDVKGAAQTELMLNFQFRNQIGLVDFIDSYIKDLVDTGTAIIRTSWELQELSREVEQDVVKYVDAPELGSKYAELIEIMRQDPQLFKRNNEPELALALKMSIEAGRPLRREVVKTETVTVVETIKNQPKVEVCDYRDVIPDPTCKGKHSDMKFCGYRIRTTKADLLKDSRYSNVDDIVVAECSPLLQRSTDATGEESDQDSDTFQFKDPNRQPIEGIEYWGFVDVDGSGILSPVVFTWFGKVLVRAEENPYPDKKIPFTFVPYLKKRNSLYGEPDGILLEEDQKISGAITRGVIDILAKNANGQRGIPKGALDYSNLILFREGKDYEYNPATVIGRDGLATITKFPEIPQTAIAIQQISEQNIKEMTGTNINMLSQNQGVNLGTQSPSTQIPAMSKAARRELGILRRIANGIIEVGHKICAMNMEFLNDEEIVRITDNDFEVINKEYLDCSYDLSLSISTAEDDAVRAQELSFMLQTSTGVMDQGFVRELLADISELRRMPDKAHKYRNYQPQVDPLEQKKRELEIAKLQAELEEIQARTDENRAEAERERANARKMLAEAKLAESKAEAIDLKYLEDDTGLTHERELEKQQAQAKGNISLEKAKKDLELRNNTSEGSAEPNPEPLSDNLTTRDNIGKTTPSQSTDEVISDPKKLFDELDELGRSSDLIP